jgi:hypothetical protein
MSATDEPVKGKFSSDISPLIGKPGVFLLLFPKTDR